MMRSVFAAFLVAGLAAGAAQAQAPESAIAGAPTGGVVAGGLIAIISGSGDDMMIQYASHGAGNGATFEQPGRAAIFTGSDGDGRPTFLATAPAMRSGLGREARLAGSGDDAMLTYVEPGPARPR